MRKCEFLFTKYSIQIRTGFQKWIHRYVSECSGQRNYKYHTQRLEKITDNAFRALGKANPDMDLTAANWVNHFEF